MENEVEEHNILHSEVEALAPHISDSEDKVKNSQAHNELCDGLDITQDLQNDNNNNVLYIFSYFVVFFFLGLCQWAPDQIQQSPGNYHICHILSHVYIAC